MADKKENANENWADVKHMVRITQSQEQVNDFEVDLVSYHFAPNPPKATNIEYDNFETD